MRPLGSIVASIAVVVVCEFISPTTQLPSDDVVMTASVEFATLQGPSEIPDAAHSEIADAPEENVGVVGPHEAEPITVQVHASEPTESRDLKYLKYYVYSEIPPDPRPADIALGFFRDIPVGTPLEEIKRVSDAFGLDFTFMKTVAKIESDFDPKQRTGSYIGLFQLSKYEFAKYGSGEITSARDNAIAAAYKFINEATQFEWDTHKKPTASDLYLIHQQGWQGAAEHVSHPERIAWQSMCATDEGKEKGEKWCKRAIWQNTLPIVKHVWKSVDNLTSAWFVDMWRQRVEVIYSRYSEAVATK
jgi:hypothetical protein